MPNLKSIIFLILSCHIPFYYIIMNIIRTIKMYVTGHARFAARAHGITHNFIFPWAVYEGLLYIDRERERAG